MSDQFADLSATWERDWEKTRKLIGTVPRGARVSFFRGRIIVAGQGFPAYYLNMDGTTEPVLAAS